MAILRCTQCGSINRMAEERVRDRPVCGRCKARLDTTGAPQAATGEGLAQVVQSSPVPVLVDYWAAWCGPCRTAAPILEQIGRRGVGNLLVLKVNVDEEQGEAGDEPECDAPVEAAVPHEPDVLWKCYRSAQACRAVPASNHRLFTPPTRPRRPRSRSR